MEQRKLETSDTLLLRSQHYYRAITLNLTFGGEVLRSLTQKCLIDKHITLCEHLASPEVENAFDKVDLHRMKESNNLASLDVSKLTTLLLKTLLQPDEEQERYNIDKLRKNRNNLAHAVSAELEDDTLFNEAGHLISAIAKSAGSSVLEIQAKIKSLKSREVVRTVSNSDRIVLCNEYYMMKLVECPGGGKATTKDVHSTTIRFGLTKFTRQIGEGLKNVGKFLHKLKESNIIDDETKRVVDLAYSQEDKIEKLILHLVTTRSDIDILQVSKCLRSMEPNGPLLATLVENSNDGRNIKKQIDEFMKGKVNGILKQSLERCWNESVKSSTLHLYVEKKLGQRLDFSLIKDLLVQQFALDEQQNKNSFTGMKWKVGVDISLTSTCPCFSGIKKGKVETGNNCSFSDMGTKDFAEYLDEQICLVNTEYKGKFKIAIAKENISASLFKDMTKEEIYEIFPEYIQPLKLGFGIWKMLSTIQKQIGDQYEKASSGEVSVIFRPFDQPVGGHTYSRGCTKPSKGNLLVPRHEYRYLPEDEHYTSAFIAKEVAYFVAAYMNGRQNGTIHFGISKKNEDLGEIIGITKHCTCFKNLDTEIQSTIRTCFKENAAMASLCIGPVQLVPVEDDRVVIEVDVIPLHHYLHDALIPLQFPPKGFQKTEYVVYDGEIMSHDSKEVKGISSIYLKRLETRKHLDKVYENDSANGNQNENRLKHMLTQGNKYVTPFFTPVVISGNITGCVNESEIRQVLDIEYALTSSSMVFDFDTSPSLREKVEKDASFFLIKTAENLLNEKSDEVYQKKLWIHCNGYEKSPNENERRAVDIRRWYVERSVGVKRALNQLRDQCGRRECKVIFLVYQTHFEKGREPMFEIARDSIINNFPGECIVIAETDTVLSELKKEVEPFIEDFDDTFLTGISWNAVSNICKTAFRANPDIACILPCADGSTEVMSKKEKQFFTDIEILSGEECKHETEKLVKEQRQNKVTETQESFYRGQGISWFNFYFKGQVGKRSCFDYHVEEIQHMITKGKNLVEEHTIYHHPMAGGTTLGHHLLWRLSQFSYKPSNIYRCCLLKTFGEGTLQQLGDFHCFKEKDDPKPFIILTDRQTDEVMNSFRSKLKEFAYHHTQPGSIFCLILNVSQVPVQTKVGQNVLTYELTEDEKNWFQNRFEDMEKEHDSQYVDTLIGFNFMKNSFDPQFIQRTTDRLMEEISDDEEHGEKGVLKCLAVINAYEIGSHPVPVRVFDDLMESDNRPLESKLSYGLCRALRERKKQKSLEVTWNVTMSCAMKNMLTEREYGDYGKTGLCFICQPLAKAVVENLKERDAVELQDLVFYLINFVGEYKKRDDQVSKEFVKIVSKLFTEKQKLLNVRERNKFSPVIMALGQHGCRTKGSAEPQVIQILEHYYQLTDDPFIGQQLARYNISINDFDSARIAIESSIEKAPNNSFFRDTYGQVFKSHMDFMFQKCQEKEKKISDDNAAKIIELAFEAVGRFKVGQEKAIAECKATHRDENMSSFYNEIKTILELLEMFYHFQCYRIERTL